MTPMQRIHTDEKLLSDKIPSASISSALYLIFVTHSVAGKGRYATSVKGRYATIRRVAMRPQ